MFEKLLTFDEFRQSHTEVLRDDERAEEILREANHTRGWAEWPNATES